VTFRRGCAVNTCTKYRVELKYPRNITMNHRRAATVTSRRTKWIGARGWVWVDRGGF